MKDIDNEQDIVAILGWMQTPAKQRGALHERLVKRLERIRQADLWLNEYMSTRTVVPMMLTKYKDLDGEHYSESTARRDIAAAQELFAWSAPGQKLYMCQLVINLLQENIVKAGKKGDFTAVQRLSSTLLDYINEVDKSKATDPERDKKPVAVLAVFDPELLGFTENPKALEMAIAELKKPKRDVNWSLLNPTTVEPEPEDGASDRDP